VTANQSQEQQAYAEFMAPTTKAKATKAKPAPKPVKGQTTSKAPSTAGLTTDMADGRSQVAQLSRVQMPVYFPKEITSNSHYCLALTGNCGDPTEPASAYAHSYPRSYEIRDQQGTPHAAYRMTLVINSAEGLYYGVQGTTWHDPPLLASPSGTRTINGRKLFLYASDGKLTTVAWHLGTDTYWISNTLTSSIPNQQMVAMAASMVRGR